MKMDVIPGRENHVPGHADQDRAPTRASATELCGAYHSRMLFNVEVVSQADYDAYLQDLEAQGIVADEPLLGGARRPHAGRARLEADESDGGDE